MRELLILLACGLALQAAETVKVLVWDERQPRQAEAYDNFLGNEVAARLSDRPGLKVESVGLDDPGLGLKSLEEQHVLVWWGHVRHPEVPVDVRRRIVERVRSGKLALISLH